jgi:hypothetical protein
MWLVAAGTVLALLVVAELAAPWFAQGSLHRALAPCVAAEEVRITGLRRPLVPQLLLGRARDVEVEAAGVRLGDLRVERITASLPLVDLPWGLGAREQPPAAAVTAEVTAADARAQLWAITPFGLQPTLRFVGGEVVIGAPGLGVDARFVPVVEPGRVALVPALGPPAWWTALGVAPGTDLPSGVVIDGIDVGEGLARVRGSVALDALGGGAGGCEEPVAAPEVVAEPDATGPGGPLVPGP